jgi:FkbM family methyltransferase
MIISKIAIRVLNKISLLPFFNIKTTISVNNRKVIIPIIAQEGLNNVRLSETWMTEVLKKLQPVFNGHFIDVGVNIGQTLIKAFTVFNDVKYIGFEPNPSCLNYCKNLIEINGFSNCSLIPIGIGEKTEVTKLLFFSDDKLDSSATIIQGFRNEETVVKKEFIPVFKGSSLSNILPTNFGSILKIDVEGAELEVIEGFHSWINTTRPIILTELLPVYSVENTFRLDRQQLLNSHLKNMNYVITRIGKNESITLLKLNEFDINDEIENSDYIFIPIERVEEIISLFNS